tara:strand:+ start:296 stop:742 length:447 start_codon:yes stop_codon:yes gene_type:complete
MKTTIPPPLITLICALLIFLSKFLFPELTFNYSNKLCLFFLISGFSIILISCRTFKKQKTTINPIKIEKASSLVTCGIFKYSRNPMYLGMLLILISTAIKFSFYGGVIVIGFFVYFITIFQILPEEKAMQKLFGEDFIKYKNKTRRWL